MKRLHQDMESLPELTPSRLLAELKDDKSPIHQKMKRLETNPEEKTSYDFNKRRMSI